MNRLAKCAFVGFALVPAVASAQGAQAIYKFVDESGRVTYANSPIKGGSKVNLEPLTVLQSSPGVAQNSAPVARAIPVAKVTSVPSPSSAANTPLAAFATTAVTANSTAMPAATPPTIIAALDTGQKKLEQSQQRLAEARQRVLQNEIQAEEKSLSAARAALADEQRRSNEVRTLRSSFAANAISATPTKPLISPEIRAEIERHFERVRNLQDQMSMHESSIASLRTELVASK